MGFTPAQVDEMSIAEFAACSHGYATANGGGDSKPEGQPMSEQRAMDLGII